MEKLTLTPHLNEIVVNNGAADGAVDVFSYTPDDTASRPLGSISIIGYRDTDSSNMGYMVSLIAALARREYYAQPGTPPREAFARTLRKANEVVEEFFRNGDVALSVGIVAVAGSTLMVSKLDKFKILLARDEQVIDVLGNVALFSKEHGEHRCFSSVIHGSIQPGDRILAFVPTRPVTARERTLKTWLMKMPHAEFAERVAKVGQEHATFATAMLHITISQDAEPAAQPSPQPRELLPETPVITPKVHPAPAPMQASMAWAPRQQQHIPDAAPAAPIARDIPRAIEPEPEMPRIISSEFALGIRRNLLSRWGDRIRFIRFDKRGKAVALGMATLLIAGGALGVRSFLFTNTEEQAAKQVLTDVSRDLELARSKTAQNEPSEARQILTRALSALAGIDHENSTATALQATIGTALDEIDNARVVSASLVAAPQANDPVPSLAAWASASQTIWVGGISSEGTTWAAAVRDGAMSTRVEFGALKADLLLGWRDGVAAIDLANRTIARSVGGVIKPYTIPTQEALQDAVEFADSIYVLTDTSILKITDLDTDKPVTKQWLTKNSELVTGAERIWVDGTLWTMGRGGELTTYYKGARTSQNAAPLAPSGAWRLIGSPDGLLSVAQGDARRLYLLDPKTAQLDHTLKIESDQPFVSLSVGPDYSTLLVAKDGRVWKVQ
ncbi:MAG: hypothetical protein IT405_00500 [Candidatus Yanofskybacteria bacterium]|nr:hypothetical protein [Candidatus Yanofskybacteria bacterium]